MTATSTPTPVLQARGLVKRYGQVTSIDGADCDLLAWGAGLGPSTGGQRHLGCRIDNGAVAVDAHQRTSRDGCFAAGECTGVGGSELAVVEGGSAGYGATGQTAQTAARGARRPHWQAVAGGGGRRVASPESVVPPRSCAFPFRASSGRVLRRARTRPACVRFCLFLC